MLFENRSGRNPKELSHLLSLLKTWTVGNEKVKAVDGGYIIDEHPNAITLSAMEKWKKRRFRRTIKELSQFNNIKPEELESEFNHFDVDNSYPASPFKCPNMRI